MFLNREEAGIRLALKLSKGKIPKNSVVVSIPRGGVIVGRTISEVLNLPLQVLLVKKIAAAQNPELAVGATGSDGVVFWDEKLISYLGMSDKERDEAISETVKTIKKRERSLGIKPPKVRGKIALIVDDGVATGATAIAASLILKKVGAKRIILATPVISKRTKKELEKYFDKIIAVEIPQEFQAVGQFYRDFPQVEDKEVKELLRNSTSDK